VKDGVLRVGVVGCGNIAGPYGKAIRDYPQLRIVGAADIDPERARAYVAEYGGRAYESLDELLADDEVDCVLNLTIHHAHPEVVTRSLNAGKHVWSEKPLAMTHAEAARLVALAKERGLRLGCSPITYLGEAAQTAFRHLRSGSLGPVRVAYAEVNHGRIETWHPAPAPFYEVGPLFDVGVYPLTLITAFLGPARRVTAYGTVLKPERVTKTGEPFTIATPDLVVAMIELANGTLVRLTADFYVSSLSRQGEAVEFHGDEGMLNLANWVDFRAPVEASPFRNAKWEPLPLARESKGGVDWGVGIADLADSIREGRPHRATGEHAAHVVEIMEATQRSAASGQPVEITSDFLPPEPMDWAL
jgi:predicted dehydrogenase